LARGDPQGWLAIDDRDLIEANDGPFKFHLDRYKYPHRHDGDPLPHRNAGLAALDRLEARLLVHENLCSDRATLADYALFPFIRQFAATDAEWFAAQPLPHLQNWLARHLASPLFVLVMQKYPPWREGDTPVVLSAGAAPA
jgi:glutathione S-transferase